MTKDEIGIVPGARAMIFQEFAEVLESFRFILNDGICIIKVNISRAPGENSYHRS